MHSSVKFKTISKFPVILNINLLQAVLRRSQSLHDKVA